MVQNIVLHFTMVQDILLDFTMVHSQDFKTLESRGLSTFYNPNMYPTALLTSPVLRVGVLVPGTTLLSSCASL